MVPKQANKPKRHRIFLPQSGLEFKTQKALKTYLYEIAEEYKNICINKDHKCYFFMCDMIDRHPTIEAYSAEPLRPQQGKLLYPFSFLISDGSIRPETKLPELSGFEKYRAYYYNDDNPQLGWEAFSLFKKCVTNKDYTVNYYVNEALRMSVRYQIDAYKIIHSGLCDLCSSKASEVDHIIPFMTVIKAFLNENNTTMDQVEVLKGFGKSTLSNPELLEKWLSYHSKCQLQCLCRSCHNKKTKEDIYNIKSEN